MKVVIMGCGRIGAEVATRLWQDGNQVAVLDVEPESFYRLPQGLREMDGATLVGNGMLEDDLMSVGIRGADVFVAVTASDSRNTLAAQKARHVFQVPRIVCRVGDLARKEMYQKLGLTAVSPTDVTSVLIVDAVGA
jgi:trk system potassium uptake protein TrkA